MSLSPDQQQRELELRRLIYVQCSGQTRRLTIPEQIAASLRRQRTAGIDFPVAWRRAAGHIVWPHDREDRHQWKALVRDDHYVLMWRAAYLRRPHPALDAAHTLRLTLDDAAERDARILRRSAPAPQGLRAAETSNSRLALKG